MSFWNHVLFWALFLVFGVLPPVGLILATYVRKPHEKKK